MHQLNGSVVPVARCMIDVGVCVRLFRVAVRAPTGVLCARPPLIFHLIAAIPPIDASAYSWQHSSNSPLCGTTMVVSRLF